MSKSFYIGLKENSFLGVINLNVPYVIQIKIFKPQELLLLMNMNVNINPIEQRYIHVKDVKESRFVFLVLITHLNYFKQKQDVVENGQIYLDVYYIPVVSKHVLYQIMRITYGMNFITRKKKDGFMLILVRKLMILLQYMNKDGKE